MTVDHTLSVPLQGDIEALVVQILQENAALDAFAPNVATNMVGFTKASRWIEVTRQGGNLLFPKIDKPRVDINVYADKRSVALDMAQLVQRALLLARGTAGFGCKITDIKVETGIYRDPDKLSDSPRYILALRFTVVPSN